MQDVIFSAGELLPENFRYRQPNDVSNIDRVLSPQEGRKSIRAVHWFSEKLQIAMLERRQECEG